jgi:hypothetical protein
MPDKNIILRLHNLSKNEYKCSKVDLTENLVIEKENCACDIPEPI